MRITAASIAGSGTMTIDRVEGRAFEAAGAGPGDIDLGAGAKCSTSKIGSAAVHCGG